MKSDLSLKAMVESALQKAAARSSVLVFLLYSCRIVGPFPRDVMALALRTFSVVLSREEHLERQSSVPHFTWIS